MKVFEGEHYYNEKGEMGVLISINGTFASDDLEMATDKRVIDTFIYFYTKNKNSWSLQHPYNSDLVTNAIEKFGYDVWWLGNSMQFELKFIPIGRKFTVECEEINGDYGEFEGYCDRLIFLEDFEWVESN